MQISKFMPLACAAVVCASLVVARADDTPAQAAARAALEQKMRELDTQEASPNIQTQPAAVVTPSVAAPEQPAAPVVVQTPPPVETQPAAPVTVETQPVVVPIPAGSDPQAAARAALDQKMRDLDAQPASNNSLTNTEATLPVITIAPVETQTPQAAPPPVPVAAAPSTPPPVNANYPGKAIGLQPIAPPPLPISPGKEAQLQALLAKYKADQVSPEEYHRQRAEILAAP